MQAPRGTRDFGPDQMEERRAFEDRLRRVLRAYNYREIQTPTFEELELFLAKSGPGIRDELYEFKDKSGRELALRPELTAPAMRFYFSTLKMEPKPLRLFYIGPCFRYDRPQAGRFREFWQVGCELVGDDSPEAHAELLRLALALFEAAGLQNFVLRIGHLGLLRSLLESVGIPRAEQAPLMRFIDKKDLAALQGALAAHKVADPARVQRFFDLHALAELRPYATQGEAAAAHKHLERVLDVLGTLGAPADRIRVDPTIARGLEYYTGFVFELDAPDLGAEKQLLGGGAYDLSNVFAASPVATVGFALGFDRTLVALGRAGATPRSGDRVDALVAALAPDTWDTAAQLALELRKAGARIELESAPVAVKKLLSRASQLKARHAVFIGPKEAQRGVVAAKNLDSGVQEEWPLASVSKKLGRDSGLP